jgi:hypothetical protein
VATRRAKLNARAIRRPQRLVPHALAVPPNSAERVNFFTGQVLTAEDLQAEQDYFRTRLRRLNLAAFGIGVVDGLEVTVAADGGSIHVSPGIAVDARGEELVVDQSVTATIPAGISLLRVYLRLCERFTRPVASAQVHELQHARVQEVVDVVVSESELPELPLIARLRLQRKRWRVVKSARPHR